MTLGGFELRVLLIPFWWILAARWLRNRVDHGFLERALIWLALTLVTIESLQTVGWYFQAPPVDAATAFGMTFCWILVGWWIFLDGRWKSPGLFTAYLVLFLAIDAIVAFGLVDQVGWIGTALVIVSLLCLAWFVFVGCRRVA